jgi:catechol 2,3-dioxygenase-like lactoylglutathione lyase family enzyme
LGALALLGVGGAREGSSIGRGVVEQGRTLNHVSLGVTDLHRSSAFYDRLLHLPVRDRGADYCEYRLENGFLGLYQDATMRRGLDHVAIGVNDYDARSTLQALRQAFPDATSELRNDDQVYIVDPDGARIQLCAVEYKR